ncbi:unnamed protein product [Nesidiocoris tenuis]|uniref:Uncharacterized protein n=1 Tax=Nesidiocoris tenuis TaxID=355587 RepID=A0A6H5HDW7_9HEMI|nr:unnamed protein product [Nesidiocoris tenuis]
MTQTNASFSNMTQPDAYLSTSVVASVKNTALTRYRAIAPRPDTTNMARPIQVLSNASLPNTSWSTQSFTSQTYETLPNTPNTLPRTPSDSSLTNTWFASFCELKPISISPLLTSISENADLPDPSVI